MSYGWQHPRRPAPFGGPPGSARVPRRLIGVKIASRCREATAVLLRAEGQGIEAALAVERAESLQVDPDLVAAHDDVAAGSSGSADALGRLGFGLADLAGDLVRRLLVSSPRLVDDVLAIAIHDPGLWRVTRDGPEACIALCDGARLAERTGLTVIDAFAAQDLACGGLGGPVLALPLWMLLAHPSQARLLLDLGRTARLTYLPPRGEGPRRMLSFDVGPGTVLPDTLAAQFTGGEYPFDPGGTLAVQGHRIAELIDHWLADPYFHRPPPRWYPLGVRPDAELHQSVQMAVDAGWTMRDLLCTATHFIAESIARAINRWVPDAHPIADMLLTGGGAQNGFLLSEIARRLSTLRQRNATEVLAGGEALEAAATAGLGFLMLDQVPGNLPSITGTTAPRVLGRLTAGAPAGWERVLLEISEAAQDRGALRNAV